MSEWLLVKDHGLPKKGDKVSLKFINDLIYYSFDQPKGFDPEDWILDELISWRYSHDNTGKLGVLKMNEIDWSKSHCGVFLCDINQTGELMPEVIPVIRSVEPFIEKPINEYLIDVKVHMLMPGQYPCIPSWHADFVPRDDTLKKEHSKITGEKMYLWCSNQPFTEFKSEVKRISTLFGDWVEMDQKTIHRGVKSNNHNWRCFIRLIPKHFVHKHTVNIGTIRRHSQVYIDNPENFTW